MTKRLLSDEEVFRRMLADPEVQKRIEETKAIARRGRRRDPGITAEELPAFLRDAEESA